MSKIGKIIEAYNGHSVHKKVDKNGWMKRSVVGRDMVTGDPETFGFKTGDYDLREVRGDGAFKWRPKSLRGIDDNNGWIKIETLEDLPAEITVANTINRRGKFVDRYKEKNSIIRHEVAFKLYSHWQPYVELKMPLY